MKISILVCLFLLISFFAHCQIVTRIDINGGNSPVTNNVEGKVTLHLFSQGAAQMQISNDGSFTNAKWVTFESPLTWRLTPEDGVKTVYAKFKDAAGNIATAEATIELDREAPTEGSVILDYQRAYTNDKNRMVNLEISALDAEKMQVSLRGDFAGSAWINYATSMKLQLQGTDGLKTVYVRFKDKAGNVSQPVSDDITLDRLPPISAKVVINNNDQFADTSVVTLSISAEGATSMAIRRNDAESTAWIPYATKLQWTLEPEGNGERSVQIRFRDSVGNMSAVATDAIIVDNEPPQAPKMSINGGNRFTRDQNVILKMSAIGASHMMVSNNAEFHNGVWIAYNITMPSWTLEPEDGDKMVYVKFKDPAGNESEAISSKIRLDRVAPYECHIKIANDDAITAASTVDLVIAAKEAKYMMLSNASTFYGARWEIYKPEYKGWALGGVTEDGQKGVFVKFRDEAGNVTDAVSVLIKKDSEPPLDGKVTINLNTPYMEYAINPDKKVQLSIFARGASEMFISNTLEFKDSLWIPYATTTEWTLEGEDGLKNVAVWFQDEAKNRTKEPAVDNIVLDRKPPYDCTLSINKGDTMTNNPDKVVVLKAKAKDAVQMMVANTDDFQGARWEGYSDLNKNWSLSGVDGQKKVYVKFKDQAGNESAAYEDEILLDRTPPKQGSVKIVAENNAQTKMQQVKLELAAQGATEMMVSNFYDFKDAKWESFSPAKDWTLIGQDGLKTVFAKFKDNVGNISLVAYDRIGLDTQAPKGGTINLNNGAKFCTNINKYVTVRLYANEAVDMMISNKQDFSDGKWQPYQLYTYNWILEGEDGEKHVYAKFRDKANNETLPITSSILLDRQEPVGEEVVINEGDNCTNDKANRVKLAIKATDAKEMMLSNTRYFGSAPKWEPYREQREWTLSGGRDGVKTVFVKFRDEAGNESGIAEASINLDTEAPVPGTLKINSGKTLTNDASVSLSFNARNATYMLISNAATFEGSTWEPYVNSKPWVLREGAGQKTVYVKFKDNCGNECTPIQAVITLAYD